MTSNKKFTTRRIVFAALMAALTTVSSGMRVVLPVDIGGTTAFHLGNIFCALSGILLGPWLGGLAAGLGSALYDVCNPLYISEAWITFLMKGIYGLTAGAAAYSLRKAPAYLRALAAAISGAAVYALLYLAKTYFYGGLLLGGLTPDAAWLTVLSKVPATVFNAAVAIILAPPLAVAIGAALKRSHLTLD